VHESRRKSTPFILLRALTYASFFIGLLLVWLPARVLASAGISRPEQMAAPQVIGMFLGAWGAWLALWCIISFIVAGRGTPAPFDPPRRLVVVGPYRFVRNPMYLGAGVALLGAALFYGSWGLLVYGMALLLVTHLFVIAYEEPTLRVKFGAEYEGYCARVHRWLPTIT
jgi:protein-S-isoprenylcysteine O-methyltransferase Ste14